MRLFSKKRHGDISANGADKRRFTWRLETFSAFKSGATLDSANVVAFTGDKFHLHMTIEASGCIGFYMHYKAPCIPKYSYHYANSRGEVMRQHTAHTIPPNTQRCGHGNTCYRPDMVAFLGDDDVLFVHLCFDDDSLTLHRMPQNNVLLATWTIPHLFTQVLNPYSSPGFVSDRMHFFVRLEIKKEAGTNDAVAPYDVNKIKELVFFLFTRKGEVLPHSIELLDTQGTSIAKLNKREELGVQTLTVPKRALWDALGEDGTLQVRVELTCGSNPIDALNALSAAQRQQQEEGAANGKNKLELEWESELQQTVRIGSSKEEYVLFQGDD